MIEVNVTGADKVVARIASMSDVIRAALRASMQSQLFRLQSQVVTGKLSGDPLRRRTGNLASSINSRLEEGGDGFTGTVGTKVRYAAVHEYGGTFTIPAHTRNVTTVFGRSVAAHSVEVRAHSATYPMRSFLRSTLSDMSSSIRDALAKSVMEAVNT